MDVNTIHMTISPALKEDAGRLAGLFSFRERAGIEMCSEVTYTHRVGGGDVC